MKLMYKYRHYIAAVLTVTVSIMLMVTSVSADRVDVTDLDYNHHCKEPVSDCTPFVTVDGSLPSMGSSGFVHNAYEDGGKYQYYYFTTDGVYDTMYLYGNYHAHSSVEQIYSFEGKVYLPRFIDNFKIDLIYDNGSDEVTYNLLSRFPYEDSYLRTHSTDSSSASALWSSNSWYGSINENGYIEYYILTISEDVEIPKGSNNIRFALTFYNSSYNNVMFVLDECYIHHKCNLDYDSGSDSDSAFDKFLGKYASAWEEIYGKTSIARTISNLYEKSGLSSTFKVLTAVSNVITFISTAILDIILVTLSPIINQIIQDVLIPLLDNTLGLLFSDTGIFISTLTPALKNIFSDLIPTVTKLNDMLTERFSEHFGDLGKNFNDLVDGIQDPHSLLFSNLVENFRELFKELFVLPEDSEYVIEFEEQKNKLANKVPFVTQIETFFAALFNEENYSEPPEPVGSQNVEVEKYTAVEIYNMYPHVFYVENTYLGLSNIDLKYLRYSLPYDFDINKEYCIKATTVQNTAMNAFTVINAEGKYKDCNNQEGYTGNLQELLILARDDVNVIQIVIYEVTEPVTDFTFNIMGTNVNVLDFSWYMPYKAFVDTVILAFVYLGFCWGLYKRLNTLV